MLNRLGQQGFPRAGCAKIETSESRPGGHLTGSLTAHFDADEGDGFD